MTDHTAEQERAAVVAWLRKVAKRFALWRCRVMDWHGRPESITVLGGFQPEGKCPRCGVRLLRDSQGWFAIERGEHLRRWPGNGKYLNPDGPEAAALERTKP